MRVLYCDFCHAVLDVNGHAWDVPARSFDYKERRRGLGPDAQPMDGSIGNWIACDLCAACVRSGLRGDLLSRAIIGNYGLKPVPVNAVADLSDFLDQFWAHREGAPVRIESGQLALIASDPATIKEPRP